MKDKIYSRLLSLGLSASLLSGYAMLQDAAFYFLTVLNVLAWLLFLLISKVEIEALRKMVSKPVITWGLTLIQVGALVYSSHPMLAASSLLCSVFVFGQANARIKKEDAE